MVTEVEAEEEIERERTRPRGRRPAEEPATADHSARVEVTMPREMRRRIRHLCLDQGISLNEWMRRAATAYLAGERKPRR